jgi:hypothetical protein
MSRRRKDADFEKMSDPEGVFHRFLRRVFLEGLSIRVNYIPLIGRCAMALLTYDPWREIDDMFERYTRAVAQRRTRSQGDFAPPPGRYR